MAPKKRTKVVRTDPKEIRIYMVAAGGEFDFLTAMAKGDTDSIIDQAESTGSVYSLQGFQDAINNDEINVVDTYVYISNIPKEVDDGR